MSRILEKTQPTSNDKNTIYDEFTKNSAELPLNYRHLLTKVGQILQLNNYTFINNLNWSSDIHHTTINLLSSTSTNF